MLVIAHIVRILRIVLIAQDLAADIVAMNHMCRIQVIPPALMGAATIVQAEAVLMVAMIQMLRQSIAIQRRRIVM